MRATILSLNEAKPKVVQQLIKRKRFVSLQELGRGCRAMCESLYQIVLYQSDLILLFTPKFSQSISTPHHKCGVYQPL